MSRRPKPPLDIRSHLFWALVWTDAAVTVAWCAWFLAVQP